MINFVIKGLYFLAESEAVFRITDATTLVCRWLCIALLQV